MDEEQSSLNLLLLGEGNFSFTYSLVKKLSKSKLFARCTQSGLIGASTPHVAASAKTPTPPPSTSRRATCFVLATALDSIEGVMKKYPEFVPIAKYFSQKKRIKVECRGGVNATQIEQSLTTVYQGKWLHPQLIIFNNPHLGLEDVYRHQSLLAHTFRSLRDLPPLPATSNLFPLRQVVLSLCDDQPFRWKLLESAARSGFVCIAAVPLLEDEYPDYAHTRGQSDARFPYKHMVQYYFCRHADFQVAGPVLYDTVQKWNTFTTATKEASDDMVAPKFEIWCRIYESFYADRIQSKSHPFPFSGSHDSLSLHKDARMDSLSLHHMYAEEAFPCMPFVHPRLAFYNTSTSPLADHATFHPNPTALAARDETRFSPFLDLPQVVAMYQVQMQLERLRCNCLSRDSGPSKQDEGSRKIPHHLDSNHLGRPLYPKEAAKLTRYFLNAYGHVSKPQIVASPTSLAIPHEVYECLFCRSPRRFSSLEARDFHMRSKHFGVNVIPSRSDIKSCEHILSVGSSKLASEAQPGVSEILQSFPGSKYCAICDLIFVDHSAFQQHLDFLTPPLQKLFVCTECSSPKSFLDERALVQHKVFKHPCNLSGTQP